MRAKGVELLPEENSTQEASVFGKRFANIGVATAVVEYMKELGESGDISALRCNGAAECKKALMMLKIGKLPEQFVEGMICEGGCVGGPSKHKGEAESKRSRDALIAEADKRGIGENLKDYDWGTFPMHSKRLPTLL